MGAWDFIGIRREAPRHRQARDGFVRWRIPFIGRGAIGYHGSGHWRVLGIGYSWTDNAWWGYAKARSLNLFGLLAIDHQEQCDLKASKPGFSYRRAQFQCALRRVF